MPKAAKIAIGVSACALMLFCIGSFALDRFLLGQTYARYAADEPSLMLTDADIASDYPYAKRGEMQNPLVEYIEKSDPGRNGHNTYFYSPASQAYLAECSEALAALSEEHAGEIPDDVLQSYMQGIDKRRANTADPELIDQIDSFLARAVGAQAD